LNQYSRPGCCKRLAGFSDRNGLNMTGERGTLEPFGSNL
jgi:hypothetical protein